MPAGTSRDRFAPAKAKMAIVATMAKTYVSPTLFKAKGVSSKRIVGQSNKWLTGGNSRARTFMGSAPLRYQ